MDPQILTKDGQIQDDYQPSIYLDASVLVDYWVAEGFDNTAMESLFSELPSLPAVREILKSEGRIPKVAEIREKLESVDTEVTCVVSPLAVI